MNGRKSFSRLLVAIPFTLMAVLNGCGPAPPVDVREQFAKGITRLGVYPFYPLREGVRLGQVFLADGTLLEAGDSSSAAPATTLVTNAAVPLMEKYRAQDMGVANRFPCSSDKLNSQITLDGQTQSYYQQTDCAVAASPDAKAGVPASGQNQAAPTVNITIGTTQPTAAAKATGKQGQKPTAPQSLTPLELAGFPSYSLASITDFTLAGSAPTAFASFLAAIGFRETTSLSVQAEGVEVASLPADDFAAGIRQACADPKNIFGNPQLAQIPLRFANAELANNALVRQAYSKNKQPYRPALVMIRRVYYLRGVRYIFSDTRAFAAQLSAAANAKASPTQQLPTPPNISMNVVTPPASGAKPDAVTAELASLQTQMDALRSAISSSSNIQVAGTFARATARGIEFVDLFQRPLAFGYVAIAESFLPERGLNDFCLDAQGIDPPKPPRQ